MPLCRIRTAVAAPPELLPVPRLAAVCRLVAVCQLEAARLHWVRVVRPRNVVARYVATHSSQRSGHPGEQCGRGAAIGSPGKGCGLQVQDRAAVSSHGDDTGAA